MQRDEMWTSAIDSYRAWKRSWSWSSSSMENGDNETSTAKLGVLWMQSGLLSLGRSLEGSLNHGSKRSCASCNPLATDPPPGMRIPCDIFQLMGTKSWNPKTGCLGSLRGFDYPNLVAIQLQYSRRGTHTILIIFISLIYYYGCTTTRPCVIRINKMNERHGL